MNYDPNSTDSMLSMILQKIEGQEQKLDDIHQQVKITNGRVTTLEVWRANIIGIVAAASAIFSALTTWIIKKS